ncbi:MAG: NAD-dependent epimerase/dehydratase family protein [Acidobacteriaceae bacterium]
MSSDPTTVLVTGASGFLGGRLAQMLVERGEAVRVLARASSDLRHLSHLQIPTVRGDLGDAAALDLAMRGVRVVYHCAACSTDWAPLAAYRTANIAGTQNMLDAALRARTVERFLHVSTTDVYGYPRVPCDESGPLQDAGLPYNRTKIQGEAAVWRAHREHGLPVTVVRPATIYGPRGKDFVVEIATLLRQKLMLLIDGGRARGGFTYVDNVATAVMQAAMHPATLGGAYNISDGTGTTWRDYTHALADALGYRRPWLSLPFRAALPLGAAMEVPFGLLRLKTRPLLTRHAVHLLGQDQEFPTMRAREEFGFVPRVSFAEGIARSAAWVRELRSR